jgi:hypothetical protein
MSKPQFKRSAPSGPLHRLVRLRLSELRWLILMWREKAYDCRLLAKCDPNLRRISLRTARQSEQRAAQLAKQANDQAEPLPPESDRDRH